MAQIRGRQEVTAGGENVTDNNPTATGENVTPTQNVTPAQNVQTNPAQNVTPTQNPQDDENENEMEDNGAPIPAETEEERQLNEQIREMEEEIAQDEEKAKKEKEEGKKSEYVDPRFRDAKGKQKAYVLSKNEDGTQEIDFNPNADGKALDQKLAEMGKKGKCGLPPPAAC